MSKIIVRFVLVSLFSLAFGTTALAASVPHTFTSGTTAFASEVNANFAALVSAINALEAKIGPHTMATLAGTYDYFEFKMDVDNISSTSTNIAGVGVSGTLVLNADGTGQINTSISYRQVTLNEVTTGDLTVQVGFLNPPMTENLAITWSLAGAVVTIPGGGDFAVVGQLLIHSTINFEGQNGLTILARR